MSPFLARLKCPLFLLLNSVGVEFLSPFGFRLERACKVDRCLWKKVNPMMEPPSGLVGTVESVLCFPSRCGNPRCERISISGVSSHRPSVSFFFAPFFFLCAYPEFSTENVAPGAPRNDENDEPQPG